MTRIDGALDAGRGGELDRAKRCTGCVIEHLAPFVHCARESDVGLSPGALTGPSSIDHGQRHRGRVTQHVCDRRVIGTEGRKAAELIHGSVAGD